MHASPAKRSYAQLPRKCDYRTDTHGRTDGRRTKWSLCAAMQLHRRHKNFIYSTSTLSQLFLYNDTLLYRKVEAADHPYVSTTFPLPTVTTEYIPVSMELKLPAYGSVKTLLPLCYVIHNRTPYPQEMEVTMDANDNFMFAGNKQVYPAILCSLPGDVCIIYIR